MSTFPKTIALLEEVNLSHPVQDVSPHGISAIGYLYIAPGSTEPTFKLWPEGANGPAIFAQYMQETVHFTEERIGTENQQRGLAIVDLIDLCAGVSDRHGFHEEGKDLRHILAQAIEVLERHKTAPSGAPDYYHRLVETASVNYRNYIANRLMLAVSEIIEAHADLRDGARIEDAWYTVKTGHGTLRFESFEEAQAEGYEPSQIKPEGPLSEIIDTIVRMLDLLGELGLAQEGARMFVRKVGYNDLRPYMHGKKF